MTRQQNPQDNIKTRDNLTIPKTVEQKLQGLMQGVCIKVRVGKSPLQPAIIEQALDHRRYVVRLLGKMPQNTL